MALSLTTYLALPPFCTQPVRLLPSKSGFQGGSTAGGATATGDAPAAIDAGPGARESTPASAGAALLSAGPPSVATTTTSVRATNRERRTFAHEPGRSDMLRGH